MSRKKKKLTPIKKHFIIPLILGAIIIICGIMMIITNQVGEGKPGYTRIGQYRIPGSHGLQITGPGAIGLGTIVVILILIYWYKENKKNK